MSNNDSPYFTRAITSTGRHTNNLFKSIISTRYRRLSANQPAHQTDKGQFPKPKQAQRTDLLVQSQPPLSDTTLSPHYNSTNANLTTTSRSESRFNSTPADSSLSGRTRYRYPYYPLPPSRFTMPEIRPQGDGRLNSWPAEPSLFAPSHYNIYGLDHAPTRKPPGMGADPAPVREPPAWRLNYKIGTGACGTVFLEKVHISGMKVPELWAVKRIPRALPNFTFKRYQAEINNLQELTGHEWFVKFNSTYQDTHYMYIAMEYIPMGDMSQSFADGYRWNESDAKVVIKQLLHGLAVMHREWITHRDLKPENIFLYLPENQAHVLRVKIGDFGTSKRIPPFKVSTYLKTTTGTQGYMAPEVHDTSKPKTNRVDIWSLGCVLYRMLAGNLLFNDPFEVSRYALTAFSSPLALDNLGFSIPCVSFLCDTLQPIPEHRPSAEDCQKKAWIMSEVPTPEYSIGQELYTKLSKIDTRAPSVHSFPDMVANRTADTADTISIP